MLARCSIALGLLVAGAAEKGTDAAPESAVVVRVTSATPGHEIRIRGVLLQAGGSMRVVRQRTPFEYRSREGRLVFAAFEPADSVALLRLELRSATPEPAIITAPRVMMGQRVGGVATEFVQGY
jgi:hypothetical protein